MELLAAVCLVRGGHEIILSAFDNFKEVRWEWRGAEGGCTQTEYSEGGKFGLSLPVLDSSKCGWVPEEYAGFLLVPAGFG